MELYGSRHDVFDNQIMEALNIRRGVVKSVAGGISHIDIIVKTELLCFYAADFTQLNILLFQFRCSAFIQICPRLHCFSAFLSVSRQHMLQQAVEVAFFSPEYGFAGSGSLGIGSNQFAFPHLFINNFLSVGTDIRLQQTEQLRSVFPLEIMAELRLSQCFIEFLQRHCKLRICGMEEFRFFRIELICRIHIRTDGRNHIHGAEFRNDLLSAEKGLFRIPVSHRIAECVQFLSQSGFRLFQRRTVIYKMFKLFHKISPHCDSL